MEIIDLQGHWQSVRSAILYSDSWASYS